jgi:hypothetical protein
MLRAILSVIVGYVALFVWVIATMTGAWFVLGSDFAFDTGTHDASTGWSVVSLILGAIGAVIAGLVTVSIARTATPAKVLAGIVLVLGLVEAVAYQMGDATADEEAQAVPGDELSVWQAATTTQPQAWYSYTLPFVGCAGVLVGCRMRRRSS